MSLYAILAHDDRMGIGKEGRLPWRIPADMGQFRWMTTARKDTERLPALIMGRVTFDSLPVALTHREVIVVGQGRDAPSLHAAIELAGPNRPVWVCGGAALYNEVIERPDLDGFFVTQVKGDFGCDRFVSEKYRLRSKHCGKWRGGPASGEHIYRFGRWHPHYGRR